MLFSWVKFKIDRVNPVVHVTPNKKWSIFQPMLCSVTLRKTDVPD